MYQINLIVETGDKNKVQKIIGNKYPVSLKNDKYGIYILVNVQEESEQLFDETLEELISKLKSEGIRSYC